VDVIDLEGNTFQSVPVSEVLSSRYTALRYIAQLYQDDYLAPLRTTLLEGSISDLVITYDELLRRTPLARRMRDMLNILEEHYHSPVDTEFTLQVEQPFSPNPEVNICLLQCRPQSHIKEGKARLPASINPADVIFSTGRVVPEGHVAGIRYVLFVPPEVYFSLPSEMDRSKIGRMIGLLNARMENCPYICVGPGRWGTSNSELGVPLGYGDIYHARALVEVSGQDIGLAPEPSFGTHFFQDLLESNIYPLAVYLDDEEVAFNRDFFYHTPNLLGKFLPEAASLADCLRLIEVSSFRAGCHLDLIMDDEKSQAVALLVPDE
jgi:pyruvate,water dikinase